MLHSVNSVFKDIVGLKPLKSLRLSGIGGIQI